MAPKPHKSRLSLNCPEKKQSSKILINQRLTSAIEFVALALFQERLAADAALGCDMGDGPASGDAPAQPLAAFGSERGIWMRGDGTSIGKSIVKCLHICHDERMTKIIAPGPQLVARRRATHHHRGARRRARAALRRVERHALRERVAVLENRLEMKLDAIAAQITTLAQKPAGLDQVALGMHDLRGAAGLFTGGDGQAKGLTGP